MYRVGSMCECVAASCVYFVLSVVWYSESSSRSFLLPALAVLASFCSYCVLRAHSFPACLSLQLKNRGDFTAFVDKDFDKYVSELRLDRTWADEPELQALASLHGVRVELYRRGDKKRKFVCVGRL